MADFIRRAKDMKHEIEVLKSRYDSGKSYPGKTVLSNGIRVLNDVLQTDYTNEFYSAVFSKKDELLDFAEDYNYVKTFFAGEQVNIFYKSLHILEIYNQSKIFIVNEEISALADKIQSIIKMSSPYNSIKDLPELNQKFITLNVELLKNEADKIKPVVEEHRSRVFDYLVSVEVEHRDKLRDKFIKLFDELREKLKTCNNVANLKNITLEADALKIRCMNEIDNDKVVIPDPPKPDPVYGGETPVTSSPAPTITKTKNISMKQLNSSTSWEIKTADDVEKYVDELKNRLLSEISDNTIIRVEF